MIILKNLPIRYKLFVTYALVFSFLLSVSFGILYVHVRNDLEQRIKSELNVSNRTIADMVDTAATVSIKNHLRAIAEKNLDILNHIHRESLAAGLTDREAQKRAADMLLSQTVGLTGYIYCIDSNGVAVVHPESGVRGKDFSHRGFIQTQIRIKQGYLEYDWQNPGEAGPKPKALYMTYFAPWDWIISVSSYKEEFSELISIEDFKTQISDLTFGETGYSYIVDTLGNAVIHPELSGNLRDIRDSYGVYIVREMINRKKGYITYHWKNPSETAAREKFVAFETLADFNWIIASSSYTSEIFSPLARIKNIFLMILALSLVCMGLVTLLVSASITSPLRALIHRFEQGLTGELPPTTLKNRQDEIGRLWQTFTAFMDQLTASRKTLLAEIKEREAAQSRLHLFEKVIENTNEGICITDEDGNIEVINRAFTEITGFSEEEAIGENPRILKSDHHGPEFFKAMWASLARDGCWSGEIWNRRKSGEAYPELLNINSIREPGAPLKYVAVFHDISEMKSKEHQIRHLAYHDSLTNLPNRALLKDRLKKAIAEARRNGRMVPILFLDLDNFKNVNDSVGHVMGDDLLKETALRMRSVIRSGDTVSRLGGDEFIIMLPNINSINELVGLVKRIQSVFDRPFVLKERKFHVTASIGISVYPIDGRDEDSLIKNADLAMYQTKSQGKNHYSIFKTSMAKKVEERVQLESDLRTGIENDEFSVYFQPRIDSSSRKATGMEALVRWIRPDEGIVPPNQFIPLAEESGLIIPLGDAVFRKSIAQAISVRETTGLDLSVSVNVSTRQFEDKHFEDMITTLLRETGFPGNRLEVEITESLLMKDINSAMERLNRLAQLGVSVAIDDFGTGYSSLAYIKRLPISVLKIDKTFVDTLAQSQEDRVIVETTILMARKLNLGLVAEGVETREQLDILSQMGQMEIQGYFFAPPMPMEKFEPWLLERQ